MKRIGMFIITLLLCTVMAMPVISVADASHPDRFVDDANLLTEEEAETLEDRLDGISEELDCDVAIVTVDSIGLKEPQAYADDYFDNNGYGMGHEDDGILLLISMENRDWAISTHAFGVTAFTDVGLAHIMEWVTPSLSNGSYTDAFNLFADYCEEFIVKAQKGKPYDKGNMPSPKTVRTYIVWLIPCLILGVILGVIAMLAKKATLGEIKYRARPASYVQTANIKMAYDKYLYRDYKKMPLNVYQKYSDVPGGSSVHRSSSGSMHGGASGKF